MEVESAWLEGGGWRSSWLVDVANGGEVVDGCTVYAISLDRSVDAGEEQPINMRTRIARMRNIGRSRKLAFLLPALGLRRQAWFLSFWLYPRSDLNWIMLRNANICCDVRIAILG